jgi:hypothetical protein
MAVTEAVFVELPLAGAAIWSGVRIIQGGRPCLDCLDWLARTMRPSVDGGR